MRESFGGSAREAAAKKFAKDLKKSALDEAFKASNEQQVEKPVKLVQPKEFVFYDKSDHTQLDDSKKTFKEGVNEPMKVGDEIDPEKLGGGDEDEELELDN